MASTLILNAAIRSGPFPVCVTRREYIRSEVMCSWARLLLRYKLLTRESCGDCSHLVNGLCSLT